jgi:hypothetical protein
MPRRADGFTRPKIALSFAHYTSRGKEPGFANQWLTVKAVFRLTDLEAQLGKCLVSMNLAKA